MKVGWEASGRWAPRPRRRSDGWTDRRTGSRGGANCCDCCDCAGPHQSPLRRPDPSRAPDTPFGRCRGWQRGGAFRRREDRPRGAAALSWARGLSPHGHAPGHARCSPLSLRCSRGAGLGPDFTSSLSVSSPRRARS